MTATLAQYQAEANPDDWALASTLANKYSIPTNIFQALIAKESSWNPNAASSSSTSVGYTHLTTGTANDLGVNPFIPAENLEGGAKYLSQMFAKFGNWTDALAHYNQGPNATSESALAAGKVYAGQVMAIAGASDSSGSTSGTSPPAQGDGLLSLFKDQLGNVAFLLIGAALLILAVLSSEKAQKIVVEASKVAAV